MSKLQERVVLVGVGGATCSGKTTLAKHLQSILPNSFIIHQDDFAPPEELIPVHPIHKVPDWDAPQGAIDWPRLRKFLKNVKENGTIPSGHKSHDHLNEQKKVPLTDSAYQAFRSRFQKVEEEQRKKGVRIIWGLVDGFLLYWDKETIDQLDARFFLRVPHDILRERRRQRFGYHTAGENLVYLHAYPLTFASATTPYASRYRLVPVGMRNHTIPEGSLWKDPPQYWEHIVFPAYIEAHKDMFENGDVEHGKLTRQRVPDLVAIEPVKKGAELTMDDIVGACCDVLCTTVRALGA